MGGILFEDIGIRSTWRRQKRRLSETKQYHVRSDILVDVSLHFLSWVTPLPLSPLLLDNTIIAHNIGGHLEVLMWARENGCPWNSDTCSWAARWVSLNQVGGGAQKYMLFWGDDTSLYMCCRNVLAMGSLMHIIRGNLVSKSHLAVWFTVLLVRVGWTKDCLAVYSLQLRLRFKVKAVLWCTGATTISYSIIAVVKVTCEGASWDFYIRTAADEGFTHIFDHVLALSWDHATMWYVLRAFDGGRNFPPLPNNDITWYHPTPVIGFNLPLTLPFPPWTIPGTI